MTERTIRDASTLSGWRKSSHSNSDGGSCLEVLDGHPTGIPVRDSKNPHGPALMITSAGWSSFIHSLQARVLGAPPSPGELERDRLRALIEDAEAEHGPVDQAGVEVKRAALRGDAAGSAADAV